MTCRKMQNAECMPLFISEHCIYTQRKEKSQLLLNLLFNIKEHINITLTLSGYQVQYCACKQEKSKVFDHQSQISSVLSLITQHSPPIRDRFISSPASPFGSSQFLLVQRVLKVKTHGMNVMNFHCATGRIATSNCIPLEAPDAHLLPVADLESRSQTIPAIYRPPFSSNAQ